MQSGWKQVQSEQDEHIHEIYTLAHRMRVSGNNMGEELARQDRLAQ